MSSTQVTYEKLTAALHARYGRSIAELHQEVAELIAVNETLVAERDELGRQGIDLAARLQDRVQHNDPGERGRNVDAGPYPLGENDGTPA